MGRIGYNTHPQSFVEDALTPGPSPVSSCSASNIDESSGRGECFNRGIGLVVVLVMLATMFIGVTGVVGAFGYVQKSVYLRYVHLKAKYLAYSGLEIAKSNFDDIPLRAIPKTNTKTYLYNNILFMYKISGIIKESVYLIKDNEIVYSVALVGGKYRYIVRANYLLNEETLQFLSISEL